MRDFFEQEAHEYLERLDRILAAEGVGAEAAELYGAARGLRGSAQMAREGRVQEVAATLEGAATALEHGRLDWSEDLRDRLRRTVDDLRHLVRAKGGPDELEERVASGVERWREVGVEPAVPGVASAMGSTRETPSATAAEGGDSEVFLKYAATELSSIVGEVDAALPELERHPRSADAYGPIIRRAGALLGTAQLERLGPTERVLRGLDEVGRSAPLLDADADEQIVEFLHESRRILAAAAPALLQGRAPVSEAAHDSAVRLGQEILERRPHSPPPTADARSGDDFPVEVVNFFRSESASILSRLERIAHDLGTATGDRVDVLRADARNALAALRDTAVTFGFNAAAARAREALGNAGDMAADELRELAAHLRSVVERPDRPAAQTARESVEIEAAEPASGPAPAEAAPVEAAPVETAPAEAAPAEAAPAEVAAVEIGAAEPEPAPVEPAAGEAARSIDDFLLRGAAARERALEVVALLRSRNVSDNRTKELLEELSDLIRLSST